MPYSGPGRPADAGDERHRHGLEHRAGIGLLGGGQLLHRLGHPRFMFVPWSPSPIAVSSATSSARCSAISPANRFIQSSVASRVIATVRRPSASAGSVHRRVPVADHLVVELDQRDRAALHLERGDVVADQVALDRSARAPERSSPTSAYITYSSISGVPPMPLTNASTRSPELNGRSSRIGVIRRSAICEAGPIFSRKRPGSPWMPMPISISSSAELEARVARGGRDARRQRHAHRAHVGVDAPRQLARPPASERRPRPRAPQIFSTSTVHADAAAAGGVERVLHRHVVVDEDRLDLDALGLAPARRPSRSSSRRRCSS